MQPLSPVVKTILTSSQSRFGCDQQTTPSQNKPPTFAYLGCEPAVRATIFDTHTRSGSRVKFRGEKKLNRRWWFWSSKRFWWSGFLLSRVNGEGSISCGCTLTVRRRVSPVEIWKIDNSHGTHHSCDIAQLFRVYVVCNRSVAIVSSDCARLSFQKRFMTLDEHSPYLAKHWEF